MTQMGKCGIFMPQRLPENARLVTAIGNKACSLALQVLSI